MKALVTGATGLIGRRLVQRLESAVILSRDPLRAREKLNNVEAFTWHPESGPPPAEALVGIDTIFHLSGEPVAEGRWTTEKKRSIRASRILGTRNLVNVLKSMEKRPAVLVAASAVGYYGDRGDQELTEDAAPAESFLAEVCTDWEAEALGARDFNLRVVMARTGIVLAPDGGALSRMLPLFRRGLGGKFGSGRQWMPWVHVEDVVGLLLHAARTNNLHGPMNVVSPNPVTNREFTKTLAQALRRPALLSVPRFGLRAAFGEMSQILVASQRVLPQVAENTGYHFRYKDSNLPFRRALLGIQ